MSKPLLNDDTFMIDQLSMKQAMDDPEVQHCEASTLQGHQMFETPSNDIFFMTDRLSMDPMEDLGAQNFEFPEPTPLHATEALFDDILFTMDEDISFSQKWEMTSSQPLGQGTVDQETSIPLVQSWELLRSQPCQMEDPFPDDFKCMLGRGTMEQEANVPVFQNWELPRSQPFQSSGLLLDDALFTMHQLPMDHLNDELFTQGKAIPKPQSDHILDPLPDDNGPILDQPSRDKLRNVSFVEKWDILKPALENLYLHQGKKLPYIVEFMKVKYGFDAK
jgi:hypothetical protein